MTFWNAPPHLASFRCAEQRSKSARVKVGSSLQTLVPTSGQLPPSAALTAALVPQPTTTAPERAAANSKKPSTVFMSAWVAHHGPVRTCARLEPEWPRIEDANPGRAAAHRSGTAFVSGQVSEHVSGARCL